MIDSRPDCSEAEEAKGKVRWKQYGILAAMCALVVGVYAYTARPGYTISSSLDTADAYYNLLVQAFRTGQLNLKTDVPSGLARLADPYDPKAHARYPVTDMSYYKGKLYLYFGVTPALLLFWPYVALTGHYLPQEDAAVIFCLVGFLASVGLLCALWRRYFAKVSVAVVAAGTLALGLATGTPSLLARCDIHEVSVSCGYALTMLALAAIWRALHEPERRCRWLMVASLAYGLAVGARPSLLFGAVILLVPIVQARRERRPILAMLMAALGPVVLIGLGLMLYNARRFDNPFEFGQRYQLGGERQITMQFFSLHYVWFNFRVYALEPVHWSTTFPFVHQITAPPLPAGYFGLQDPFGVLTNVPLVWLALAAPLAGRERSGQERSAGRWFLAAVCLFFGMCAVTLALYCSAAGRYEVDFLPALVLLAVVGILGLERRLAEQPVRRRLVRWGWSVLLGFSVAFNLLLSVGSCADAHRNLAVALHRAGRIHEAIGHFEKALRLKPDLAEAHYDLGFILEQVGRLEDAMGHYEQAVRINPDFAEAHNNLGLALQRAGRIHEAIGRFEQALRLKPDLAEAHYNLGFALEQVGRLKDATGHYEQAVRINPDFAEAHYYLGFALEQAGKPGDAMGHYEQAVRIKPDFAEAHYSLGVILEQMGRLEDAKRHYEQAVRIKPDFVEAERRLVQLRTAH